MQCKQAVHIAAVVLLGAMGEAQTLITTQRDPYRPTTPASPTDYTVSYGGLDRRPTNYDYYYYNNNRNPYVLSPYMVVAPTVVTRPPVAPVPKLNPVEYGKVMEQAVSASTVQPASARTSVPSVVDKPAVSINSEGAKAVEAQVVDVLDRGLLVLDSYDEVKLRGVTMESENEVDDVTRYYARLGIDTIRRLVMSNPVYIQLGTPERSSSGPILADVYLADGTLLNRQILELGYGRFDQKDFLPGEIPVTLQAAETRARNARVGLFSK